MTMKIIDSKKIDLDERITFIRVEPGDLIEMIETIINELSNLSWIAKFDQEYIRTSFDKRASDTAKYLAENIKLNKCDQVTGDTGEYIVSEVARKIIVTHLGYLDIPLAELFKEQLIGNPGFDYYSANKEEIIIFGEAKYISDRNAYGRGMEQVSRFIEEKQDISD